MCGRYTLTDTAKLATRFGVKVTKKVAPSYNVAPGQFMPVVRAAADDSSEDMDVMKWGLVPSWAKDPNIGYKMINARSETVFEKPAWRSAIVRRRCLVPATGFYEWKRDGTAKKQPYYIRLKRTELFAFAGIWESWHEPDGSSLHSYSILTTSPNKEMSELHDRMPVILHKDEEDAWLHEDDRGFIEQVLQPYEDGALELVPVSKDVNVVKNNDGHLILPINSK